LTLPWSYYGERNDPYDTLSSAPFDPAQRPKSVVPENLKFLDIFVIPAYLEKLATPLPRRLVEKVLRPTLEVDLPNALLAILVPVGLLGLMRRGRWVPVAMLPPFLLLYADSELPFLTDMARDFAEALKKAKDDVELKRIDRRNHNGIFFRASNADDPVNQAIVAFVKRLAP
jgi:hypothetical protein